VGSQEPPAGFQQAARKEHAAERELLQKHVLEEELLKVGRPDSAAGAGGLRATQSACIAVGAEGGGSWAWLCISVSPCKHPPLRCSAGDPCAAPFAGSGGTAETRSSLAGPVRRGL
jgi:hypothetical protein